MHATPTAALGHISISFLQTRSEMDVLPLLLLDEEEAHEEMLVNIVFNDEAHPMYKRRKEEGTYKMLILQHLVDNDTKFREYFRLTPSLFGKVLSHLTGDLKFRRNSISPREKLCITLRYVHTYTSVLIKYSAGYFQFRKKKQISLIHVSSKICLKFLKFSKTIHTQ